MQAIENDFRLEQENADLYAAALEETQRSQHAVDSTGPVRSSKSSIQRRGSLEVGVEEQMPAMPSMDTLESVSSSSLRLLLMF